MQKLLEELKLRKNFIKPEFSWQLLNIMCPTCSLLVSDINVDLCEFPKNQTPQGIYTEEYQKLNDQLYRNHIAIYTDGSKEEIGVGAEVVCEGIVRTSSLPIEASVFSSEMHALNIALDVISMKVENEFMIFSHSLSVVRGLQVHCYNSSIRRLIHRIYNLQMTGKTLCICWIPSHIGIEGNELADAAAKATSKRPEEPISTRNTDFRSIRCALVGKWKQQWELCRDKLKEIKPAPKKWKIMLFS